jgi:hypothetical protein
MRLTRNRADWDWFSGDAAICPSQFAEFVVRDRGVTAKSLRKAVTWRCLIHVTPAVGPLHRLECRRYRDKLGGHHTVHGRTGNSS